ncbi:uncharacterized protein LOC116535789 [Sapajus apella]|uniref:Uncharacterized protein LOC116535789 n=1 Tax=Sapajus apella TaxID=9515 RepID=A0A6J3G5E6_SAPAP|nr:uncharacterized protein LOC116535789 [Sapajus apella]
MNFLCGATQNCTTTVFFFKTSTRIKLNANIRLTGKHCACAILRYYPTQLLKDPLAGESPLRLLSCGLQDLKAGSKKKEMVIAHAPLFLRLRPAAQAHRYHFDRKHPADLNRGFGRQEEPRHNGSHLVCLSESERRHRLWRRRELPRSYTSKGSPPFPAPSPNPFPLPGPPSPPNSQRIAR